MKTLIQSLCIALAIFAGINPTNATTVFPIATNASVEELCGGIAASGSNYLVGFVCGTNACYQLVSTNGSLPGPAVTNGPSDGNPLVAKSGTCYLEVWFDDFSPVTTTTFGQIISFNGAKVGSAFAISTTNEVFALASDGTNFLVVLNVNNGNTGNFNVYGQIITSSGSLSGPQFLISDQEQNGKHAAAAFGQTNYLVIWQSNNGSIGNTNLTYGSFVSPNGTVGTNFAIGQTHAPDQNFLAVAFDGTNFLTAWNWDPYPETGGNVTNWEIFGRLVSPSGTFPANELQLVTDPGNDFLPSLAFDGTNYLLAWGYGFEATTNTNIRFQFFNQMGCAVTPEFTWFSAQGTNVPALIINGLVFDGTRYAAAATLGTASFSSGDVYGGFLSSSFSGQPPRMISLKQNGLLTWTNVTGMNSFVFPSAPAAIYDPSGTNSFVLEWAPSLTGPWSYAESPLDVTISTNTQTTVSVPTTSATGFYRLSQGFGPQTFHGVWVSIQTDTTDVGGIYLIPNGNGTITNAGSYNYTNPPGYYCVSYNGEISINLDSIFHGVMTVGGQFEPPNEIALGGDLTNNALLPVQNVSLCSGTWNGALTETDDPSGLKVYSIELNISTNGFASVSGDFLGTGGMFALAATNGALSGFFKNSVYPSGAYNQFQLNGTLTGNSITGSYSTDSTNDADLIDGTFTLTR